jgi:hypothetical protein
VIREGEAKQPQHPADVLLGHGLAMTPDRMVRMKPQNLVTGLPLVAGARAA